MHMHVKNGQECVGIALNPVSLDRCADRRLGKNKLGQLMGVNRLCVGLEYLPYEAF